jgi:hypothetical protein
MIVIDVLEQHAASIFRVESTLWTNVVGFSEASVKIHETDAYKFKKAIISIVTGGKATSLTLTNR